MKSKRKSKTFPQRGHVYLIRFDPARGREIKKTRPALIVSNNSMNEYASTVLVMPITSGRYNYYFRVPLKSPEGGLKKSSVIATEQVRAVDKQRIGKRLGKVRPLTMLEVEQAIRDHFGLPEGDVLE